MLRAHKMPPDDSHQPRRDQRATMVAWLETALRPLEAARPADPGRVTMRRLNRTEYANTIRDLLGVEFNAAADLPSDLATPTIVASHERAHNRKSTFYLIVQKRR